MSCAPAWVDRKILETDMAVETKGHSAISAVMRVKPPRRMHGLIVGVSFAVGLTFGATAGFAQIASDSAPATDETVEATTAEPAMTDTDGAETPEVPTTEATAQGAAPSDAPLRADQEMVAQSGDATSAVVFMYHRFGEGEYPSTNITMEQFDQHVKELTSGPYTVMGVPQIISALADGNGLPDRTIGITIDDAYRSVYEKAWPVFREYNLPFTVFVSTEQLDSGYANYMTWDMVRELSKAGDNWWSQPEPRPSA